MENLTIHSSSSSALDFCSSVYLCFYSSSRGSSDAPLGCGCALFVFCSYFGSSFSPCSCSVFFLLDPLLLLVPPHPPPFLIFPTYPAGTVSLPSFFSPNISSEMLWDWQNRNGKKTPGKEKAQLLNYGLTIILGKKAIINDHSCTGNFLGL